MTESDYQLLSTTQCEDLGLRHFIQYMNSTAEHLELSNTQFAVSHGMHHDDNYSSAFDMGRLSLVVMNHPTYSTVFQDVVSTKIFQCKSKVNPNHMYRWENTNKMLWENSPTAKPEFNGVKTGITPTAGPCLSCSYDSPNGQFKFLVIILCCKSPEARWKEIPRLCEWAGQKIKRVKQLPNIKPGMKKRILKNLAHIWIRSLVADSINST